jgi:type I restriction enzyme, S subunit
MIAPLKPYPAYKDSGVQWLGQVPLALDDPQSWLAEAMGSNQHTVLRENTPPDYEFSYIDIGRLRLPKTVGR